MKKLSGIFLLFGVLAFAACDGDRDVDCEFFDDCDGGGSGKKSTISVTIKGSQYAGAVEIYFNNEYKGVTTGYYVSPPSCDANGSLTLDVDPGYYTVTGTWGGSPISTYSNVNAIANTCHKVHLSL